MGSAESKCNSKGGPASEEACKLEKKGSFCFNEKWVPEKFLAKGIMGSVVSVRPADEFEEEEDDGIKYVQKTMKLKSSEVEIYETLAKRGVVEKGVVPELVDSGECANHQGFFMVTRRMDCTIATLLERIFKNPLLSPSQKRDAANIALEKCVDTMQAFHKLSGMVHMDTHMGNFMFSPCNGVSGECVLIDFDKTQEIHSPFIIPEIDFFIFLYNVIFLLLIYKEPTKKNGMALVFVNPLPVLERLAQLCNRSSGRKETPREQEFRHFPRAFREKMFHMMDSLFSPKGLTSGHGPFAKVKPIQPSAHVNREAIVQKIQDEINMSFCEDLGFKLKQTVEKGKVSHFDFPSIREGFTEGGGFKLNPECVKAISKVFPMKELSNQEWMKTGNPGIRGPASYFESETSFLSIADGSPHVSIFEKK
jgi:hypothetical protein